MWCAEPEVPVRAGAAAAAGGDGEGASSTAAAVTAGAGSDAVDAPPPDGSDTAVVAGDLGHAAPPAAPLLCVFGGRGFDGVLDDLCVLDTGTLLSAGNEPARCELTRCHCCDDVFPASMTWGKALSTRHRRCAAASGPVSDDGRTVVVFGGWDGGVLVHDDMLVLRLNSGECCAAGFAACCCYLGSRRHEPPLITCVVAAGVVCVCACVQPLTPCTRCKSTSHRLAFRASAAAAALALLRQGARSRPLEAPTKPMM
jgi:hypothetical protein